MDINPTLARGPRSDVARIEAQTGSEHNPNDFNDEGAVSAKSVRIIAIAMMRDAHRLIGGPRLPAVVDAISWVWGSDRGFSLTTCCDAVGLDPDVARAEYWLTLNRVHPGLSQLVRTNHIDEVREIIQREVSRATEGAGQLDLFTCYENTPMGAGTPPALH